MHSKRSQVFLSRETDAMQLSVDWILKTEEECGAASLGLVSVICISGDLIYIFANSPNSKDADPSTVLPQLLSDLLIFEPVIPLRYTPLGFQSLLPSEWSDMSAQKDSYVGRGTRSSAQESPDSITSSEKSTSSSEGDPAVGRCNPGSQESECENGSDPCSSDDSGGASDHN